MNLYEHQSSYNPNMPVRGLIYFAKLYQNYIDENELNVFSTVLKHMPTPRFIVFYNGTREEPDRKVLSLTDAFQDENGQDGACLECRATMLNINYGHNYGLMEKCRRLEEYSFFVNEVRKALESGGDMHDAVEDAVDTCVEKGILRDILIKERAEVINMVLSCTKKQYERLVQKEVEQQEKQMQLQKKKLKENEEQIRFQKKKLRESEEQIKYQKDSLALMKILAKEGRTDLVDKIEDDKELREKLLREYGLEKGDF